MTNKKSQAITKELFIRCRKLNIPLLLMTQYYFSVPKEVRLNSTHYLIMRIYNKRELQKKLLSILQQTLIIKIFWRFIGNAQVQHILF